MPAKALKPVKLATPAPVPQASPEEKPVPAPPATAGVTPPAAEKPAPVLKTPAMKPPAVAETKPVPVEAKPTPPLPPLATKPVALAPPVKNIVGTIEGIGQDAAVKKVKAAFPDAKEDDVKKFIVDSWDAIKAWKVTNLVPYAKNRFGSSGSGAIGGVAVGSTDQVREKQPIGASVFILKDGKFLNYSLPGKMIAEVEALTPGRQITAMRSAKWQIDAGTVASVPLPEKDFFTAILNACIPAKDFINHKFAEFETFAFIVQMKPASDEFSNPMPMPNSNDLKFTAITPALVDWEVSLWLHARQFGEAYISVLGEAELDTYRKLEGAGRADFLGAILAGQVVLVVGKVGREAFKVYNNEKSLEVDVLALILYPEDFPPVVIEPRPEKQPAASPAPLPENVLKLLDLYMQLTGESEEEAQQTVMDRQSIEPGMSMEVALAILIPLAQAKVYQTPARDTPTLKVLRATAEQHGSWDFSYKDFMDMCAGTPAFKDLKLEESVFTAFVTANKPAPAA